MNERYITSAKICPLPSYIFFLSSMEANDVDNGLGTLIREYALHASRCMNAHMQKYILKRKFLSYQGLSRRKKYIFKVRKFWEGTGLKDNFTYS